MIAFAALEIDSAAVSRRNIVAVDPEKQQPWPEEVSLNQYAMVQAYLLKGVTGIGYLALTWSTVVLLGGFVTTLGKKDFWCLTFISMMQAAGIFNDWGEGVMSYFFINGVELFGEVLINISETTATVLLKKKHAWIYWLVGVPCCLFTPIWYLMYLFVCLVVGVTYCLGSLICAGISLWRIIQHDYGNMDGDSSKANLMPALDFFYYLILCQGALSLLWWASHIVAGFWLVASLKKVCKFPQIWSTASVYEYLLDTLSKCSRNPKSIKDRRLVKYAVDLLDSESPQDYLSGARMLDVLIKVHQVDLRPLILLSSQKVEKLIDTLRRSSSDREIKELASRILANLVCDRDVTQFPAAIRCISSLLQLPYWNNQQGTSNQSPQSDVLDQLFAEMKKGKLVQLLIRIKKSKLCQLLAKTRNALRHQLVKGKLDQRRAVDSEGDRGTTLPYWNNQHQSPQSKLDHQGAGDSQGDGWNELILQGLTILERLASDQHNCRDICSSPDLIAKIMSPIYSDTLIQDINIMPTWQDVVNGAFRVVHRLICAPEWTGGRRLAHEISCSKKATSNLETILDQSNTATQQLQMRAMEILTELALDPSANLAMETKENLINKQLQIFLNEGKEEDLKVTAGKTLLALLSKTGIAAQISVVCEMSKYNHNIVDQVTEILDAKNKVIYRTIAAEILENLCALHTMDKNHVKNTLLPKVLAEVLTSKKKPPSEAPESHVSKASGEIEEIPLQDDEENQRVERNVQINSSEQNETQTAMMEFKEALLSLTSVIFDKWIISAEDFNDVARKVAPGEGEFVAKLKTIVEENCEATANSLRIVKRCGQVGVTMMRRSQYNTHFKDQKFVETLSKASSIMCNLESFMLFAGTDGGVKKTARPLLSDLVKEAQALVA